MNKISKMELVPQEEPTEPKIPTVVISVELMQNIRNIIEVANARIQWKTEELLPVGLVIKQIDEHLKPFIKKTDSGS